MKLIINTSNLYVGGGKQVALSFINELKGFDHEFHIFLSKAIDKQINQSLFPNNFQFYLIENSPSKIITRNKIISKLDSLVNKIEPDIVFSVFGPGYWKPKVKHIMGFAIPWVLQKDSVAYSELDFLSRITMRLRVEYLSYYTKRDASHYIIETEDGKNKLSKSLNIHTNNIFVVGNSYSSIFNNTDYLAPENEAYLNLPEKEPDEFRLLLISHNYPHKNIKIINDVLPLLKNHNIKFVLTIDTKSYQSIFKIANKQIINLGTVKEISCPSLYSQCDALFLPSLLEVFSASYPEAMKMGKPILTSNYSFATDVCQDAALYFDPLKPIDIAEKIIKIVNNKDLQEKLILKGKQRMENFETAKSRAKKYLSICEHIVNQN